MDQAEQLRRMVKMQNTELPNARVIAVTSGKGGVGKSTISVNLALQFKKLGQRVVILDTDFGLANVEVMLGVRPKYTIKDVIYDKKSIQDIITMGPNNIGFISGGSGVEGLENLTKEQIKILIGQLVVLDAIADVVIIDTGAGISDSVLEFVLASPEVLLVVTPEPTSITDAYALLKSLSRKEEFNPEETRIRLLANRVQSENEGQEIHRKINLVSSKFINTTLSYLGAVPYDNMAAIAALEQRPISLLNPNASSAKAYAALALRLNQGTEVPSGGHLGIAKLFMNLFKGKGIGIEKY